MIRRNGGGNQPVLNSLRPFFWLVLFLLAASACSISIGQQQTIPLFERAETPLPPPQSDNPPASIQRVVAYRYASEGVVIYLVFADRDGKQTTAVGRITLIIKDRDTGYIFYRTSRDIVAGDFVETQVGSGLFRERRIVYSFDLVPYEDFARQPENSTIVQVDVTFSRTGGSTLRGETLVTR